MLSKTKLMVSLMTIIILALLLSGCNSNQNEARHIFVPEAETPSTNDNFDSDNTVSGSAAADIQLEKLYFTHNGVQINMNDDMSGVLEKMGEPLHMFESPSCAFEGIDRIFYFEGFIIDTYPHNGNDYVLSIVFRDDSASTQRGISLGSNYDDMIAAYGNDYVNMLNLFSYVQDGVRLSFLFEDDKIVDVTYYNMLALN
ncbi:MAG: hypothetical protein FWE29_01755 [Defluviitaleaceae bacterium]|nr:hypothetical protein [Defluviitaleaceae bacterium]